MRVTGVCVGWKNTFGWIRPDVGGENGEYFAHFSAIEDMESPRNLARGQRVSFVVGEDGKGREAALQVRVIE